jgi:hypothetical protein
MKLGLIEAAARTFYPAMVLALPVGSPRRVRNAEPHCSAAASARSGRRAKRKLKQASMDLLQFRLEVVKAEAGISEF